MQSAFDFFGEGHATNPVALSGMSASARSRSTLAHAVPTMHGDARRIERVAAKICRIKSHSKETEARAHDRVRVIMSLLSTVKLTLTSFGMLLTGACAAQNVPPTEAASAKWKDASVYAIDVKNLDGTKGDLKQFEGKVAIIVNTASQCGLTPQYAALEALALKYKDRGVVVLGFPSGDFGGQEFESASEIREFCTIKYKITFPLFEKCSVNAGATQSPIFECLAAKTGKLPGWNFGKYIVSKDGKSATFFDSRVAPDSKEIEAAILAAIQQ